jgi:hypothetical protein
VRRFGQTTLEASSTIGEDEIFRAETDERACAGEADGLELRILAQSVEDKCVVVRAVFENRVVIPDFVHDSTHDAGSDGRSQSICGSAELRRSDEDGKCNSELNRRYEQAVGTCLWYYISTTSPSG